MIQKTAFGPRRTSAFNDPSKDDTATARTRVFVLPACVTGVLPGSADPGLWHSRELPRTNLQRSHERASCHRVRRRRPPPGPTHTEPAGRVPGAAAALYACYDPVSRRTPHSYFDFSSVWLFPSRLLCAVCWAAVACPTRHASRPRPGSWNRYRRSKALLQHSISHGP